MYLKIRTRMALISLVSAIMLSGCNSLGGEKQTMGTFVGGATGALAGAQFGKGHGQLAMTAVGAILGAAIGNDIGQSLDEVDRMKSQQAFSTATNGRLGTAIAWNNPNSGHSGTVIPVRDGHGAGGEYCREFQQTVNIGGKQQSAYGTACRMADGQWRVVN